MRETEKKLCLIVPCYNEGETIGQVIRELQAQCPEAVLLVIDDGSSDNTRDEVANAGNGQVVLLSTGKHCGLEEAMKLGFSYARKRKMEFIVRFDGDGQHPAEEIDKVFLPLKTGNADLVIGSRFLSGSKESCSSWSRRLGGKLLSIIHKLLTGKTVTDPTSGFRGYNLRAVEALLQVRCGRYPEPGETVRLERGNFRIMEVAVKMRPRQGGHSSIGLWQAPGYMFRAIMAMVQAHRSGTKI